MPNTTGQGGGGNGYINPFIGSDHILIDVLPSGEQKEFLRRYEINANGTTAAVLNLELNGSTPYTVQGEVVDTHQRRNAGFESIAIDDTTPISLTVPAGAIIAEMVFKSGNTNAAIAWDDTLGVPTVTNTNTTGYVQGEDVQFTIQGVDELENFQAIALTGFSGDLQVRYKFDYKTTN